MQAVIESSNRNQENEVLAVEREMVALRRDVHARGAAVVASAKALADWKRHVRAHPWILLGVATIAGYALVPRKPRVVCSEIKANGGTKRVVVSSEPANAGLGAMTFNTLGNAVLRVGAAFIEKELGRRLDEYLSASHRDDHSDDSL
jgi:hypothetical protein